MGTGRMEQASGKRAESSRGHRLRRALAPLLVAGLGFGAACQAAVTTTGSTGLDPYSNWYYVGRLADGTLTVDGGGGNPGAYGDIGYGPGCVGTATVTGPSSQLSFHSGLYVGDQGTGVLLIQAGGQVLGGNDYVGYRAGSSGAVTITGIGSNYQNGSPCIGYAGSGSVTVLDGAKLWSISVTLGSLPGASGLVTASGAGSSIRATNFYVGRQGTGTLTVSDGAVANLTSLYASPSDLQGNGTIKTLAAVLDADLVFDATHGLTQTLAFGSGGVLTLNAVGGFMGAGYKGAGTLQITDGLAVASSGGYLGYWAGSSGAATVSGAGSAWNASGNLFVGYGGSGCGSLTVSEGALVTAGTLYASLSDLHGDGTITVSKGAVIDTDLAFDATHGLSQTLKFGSSGTLNLTVDGTSSLGAGFNGTGTLRIVDGRNLTGTTGYLGYNPGSSGTASVTGVGSTWTSSSALYVGYNGGGSLTVSDGGLVTANTLYASLSDIHGNGTVTVAKGAVLDADLVFDATHGTTQAVAFGSGGTLNLTVDSTSLLGVGYKGAGTLQVTGGRSVTANSGYLGYNAGSTGTATVAGTGSAWISSSALYVGNFGTGTVNVQAGGQVSNGSAYFGYNAGSIGTGIVNEAGSKWTSGTLYVGYSGTGKLEIQAGGQVNAAGYLGYFPGSSGTLAVSGPSTWTSNSSLSPLYVGYCGTGTLSVLDGAQITTPDAYLGYYSGSAGTAIVAGAGSKWVNSNGLYLGNSGSGALAVSDGGLVTTATLYGSLKSLSGNGSIAAKGAVLDADLVFDTAHGLTQSLAFGTGGTLSLTVDGSGSLGAGHRAAGTLRIADGRTVPSAAGYLGYSPGSSGTATVAGAGSAWTATSACYIGSGGSGTLNIQAGARVGSGPAYLGYSKRASGTVTVAGKGSIWNWDNDGSYANLFKLYVGYEGSGMLTIDAGGQVSSFDGFLGSRPGATGIVTVTGTGSVWSLFEGQAPLYVGNGGSGVLNIQAGGQLVSYSTYLGYSAGATGAVTVKGSGSNLTTHWFYVGNQGGRGSLDIRAGGQVISDALYVGFSGPGALITADGGKVTSSSLSIGSFPSAVRLRVSGNGMVVLGARQFDGSLSNTGSIDLYADAFLATGVYTPIAPYPGQSITWSGSGAYSAVGGTWDANAHTFTVLNPTALSGGAADTLSTGERLLITDSSRNERVGASFGTVTGTPTFRTDWMTDTELADLRATSGLAASDVLAAWDFTTPLSGDEVLLAFDIGLGQSEPQLWHLHDGVWTAYTDGTPIYSPTTGILTVTVTDFSGYAVTVPEPGAVAMLALGGLAMIRRRR